MTETEFRNKITWMTFLFSVMVVMIHGYNIDLFAPAGESGSFHAAVWSFQTVLSEVLRVLAVPGFFLVSAYLFCRNLTWEQVPGKMLRRVGTVLVPYIVWNSLYYFGRVAAGMLPGLGALAGQAGASFSIRGWADAVLHFTSNPVLWYMQQLILLIALAPLIYGVMARRYLGAAALLALLAVVSRGALIPILNLDALLYYSAGAYLSIHAGRFAERRDAGRGMERGDGQEERKNAGFPAARTRKWLVTAAGTVVCILLFWGSRRYASVLLTVLYGLISPMMVWYALPSGTLPPARGWMKYNFFLYAYHFLLVRGINKAGALLLPFGAGAALFLYLCLPFAVVAINWGTAEGLKRAAPRLFLLLNGGR